MVGYSQLRNTILKLLYILSFFYTRCIMMQSLVNTIMWHFCPQIPASFSAQNTMCSINEQLFNNLILIIFPAAPFSPVAPAFLQHSLEFVSLVSGFRRWGAASHPTQTDFAKREWGPAHLPLVRGDVSKDHRSLESTHSSSPQEKGPGSRASLPRAGRDFCVPWFAATWARDPPPDTANIQMDMPSSTSPEDTRRYSLLHKVVDFQPHLGRIDKPSTPRYKM